MLFTHDLSEYQRDFNFVANYQTQMSMALARMMDIDEMEAQSFVQDIIDQKDTDEVVVNFTVRKQNGDRELSSAPILKYLEKIDQNRLGMSPTMTTYLRPDQKKSLVVKDVADNMALRKIVKREGQLAKQAGDGVTEVIKNGRQNTIKRGINSWSGATKDKHNPFHCPSLHPTLTTMCRISTALATATVEKFLGGKRYYHTPEKVLEDILAVMAKCNQVAIMKAMRQYTLVQPTVDMAMEVIKHSTDYYWWDDLAMQRIKNLVRKMTPTELTAFVYDGDLFHIFKYNDEFARTFLTRMSTIEDLPTPEEEGFKGMDGDVATLISNLMGTEICGTPLWDFLDAEKHPVDNPVRAKAARVLNNINKCLEDYALFIQTFFRVTHFPINVGAQNHAIRLSVPLGDTDSTIFTTKHINELYYGEASFDASQEPVADVVVYMVNGVIAHALANFTAQLGVVTESRHLLIMKNEYKFPALQLTPVAKTYHAYVKAQEGLVFSSPDFELKGARNHAGKANVDLVKELHTTMKNNLVGLNKGELIDRGEMIDIVLRVEEDIIESLGRKDNVYFKRERIKPEAEYKKPDVGSFQYHTLWNEMFGDKYGKAPDPTYYAYKVDIDYSHGSQAFLSSLSLKQQQGIEAWRRKHNKKANQMPTAVYVPIDNFLKYGLPEELRNHVNISKVASFTLDAHRLQLQAMGLFLDKLDNQAMLTDMLEAA